MKIALSGSKLHRRVAAIIAGSMVLTALLGSPAAYAAMIDPDSADSWNVNASDGLSGDTSPVVEGKNDLTAYTHLPALQQSKTIGKVAVWNSTTALNTTGTDQGPTPWAIDPIPTLLKHYGVSNVWELPLTKTVTSPPMASRT